MKPRRGELWWAAFDPTVGSEISKTRPCLILTTDVVNEHRPSAHPPITIALDCEGRPAVAVVDRIRAIAKQRLRARIGRASAAEISAIENAIKQILELG